MHPYNDDEMSFESSHLESYYFEPGNGCRGLIIGGSLALIFIVSLLTYIFL